MNKNTTIKEDKYGRITAIYHQNSIALSIDWDNKTIDIFDNEVCVEQLNFDKDFTIFRFMELMNKYTKQT